MRNSYTIDSILLDIWLGEETWCERFASALTASDVPPRSIITIFLNRSRSRVIHNE